MFVLGLQGSPRKRGNTGFLLSAFMKEVSESGAQTLTVNVSEKNIVPCLGCGACEKTGFCVTKGDDMTLELFPLFRKAELIVMATPIYFYSTPSQLKAVIDRAQTLWSRKYRLLLNDPGSKTRLGFMLAQGATKGQNLFDAVGLTAKYFFDAVDASYSGKLAYRHIENPGDMEKNPTVLKDVKESVSSLLDPLSGRRRILFACVGNTCRSQMAAGFAKQIGGDRIDVLSGGSRPEEKVNPVMVEAMAEKGIDMAFRVPGSIEKAISDGNPEIIVTMGCGEECPFVPGAEIQDWDLGDPAGKPLEFMREVRDDVEQKVNRLIAELT